LIIYQALAPGLLKKTAKAVCILFYKTIKATNQN